MGFQSGDEVTVTGDRTGIWHSFEPGSKGVVKRVSTLSEITGLKQNLGPLYLVEVEGRRLPLWVGEKDLESR